MPAAKKLGQQTVFFQNPPAIIASGAVVGSKEAEGPLGKTFDRVIDDPYHGEKSWERAERRLLEDAVQIALQKANLSPQQVDFFLAGDLENQTEASALAARDLGMPYLGLYGACSTFYEGITVGAVLIDGGFAERVVVAVSSHCCTAEKQFRFPTEQGVQRPLTQSWTVTGAGAVVLAAGGSGPVVTHATIGKAIDLGQGDPSNFGAAMAPAATDTIVRHLLDTGRGPKEYDLVVTGDLGIIGRDLAEELLKDHGFDLADRFTDCGILIYDPQKQDTHAGGSGCACSAVVTAGYILQQIQAGKLQRVLGVGTGALLNADSPKQGETIPGIGHAAVIERR
jgi:stage V sporulation protein AD